MGASEFADNVVRFSFMTYGNSSAKGPILESFGPHPELCIASDKFLSMSLSNPGL